MHGYDFLKCDPMAKKAPRLILVLLIGLMVDLIILMVWFSLIALQIESLTMLILVPLINLMVGLIVIYYITRVGL